jgi:myogenesis-regulating glycosidase
VTSTGLLVVADPDTPFLHVGLNAPILKRWFSLGGGGGGWAGSTDADGDGHASSSSRAASGAVRTVTSRDAGPAGGGGAPGVGRAPRRSWGVGVQNMAREYLPRAGGAAETPSALSSRPAAGGDGQLRVQARASYRCPRVSHPLADWAPHDEAGGPVAVAGGGPTASLPRWVAAAAAAAEEAAAVAAAAVEEAAVAVVRGAPPPPADAASDAAGRPSSVSSLRSVDLPDAAGVVPATPSASPPAPWLSVSVALISTPDARSATRAGLAPLPPPRRTPSKDVLEAPIWTTWARYFSGVDQAKVLRYAHEVVARGLPRSVLEIDDRWQTFYGDLAFDARKFPDARGMVAQLHAMGFKVTAWVMPFAEAKSAAYKEGAAKGFFIESRPEDADAPGQARKPWWRRPRLPSLLRPGFFRWWNTAPVCALDVTNPAAVAWFVGRLRALQAETGLDGFKFDAGEPCFLPPRFRTRVPIAHPTEYTRLYVSEVAAKFAGGASEVRTGHRGSAPAAGALLTRMGDRFSTWSVSNGLRSIIPTLLTSGLQGYPFTLPDMVGGNAYFGAKPDAELVIRWTQANALMPALQFSVPPWDVAGPDGPAAAVEALCAAALRTRAAFAPALHALADDAAHTLQPICRPMWWLAPSEPDALAIDDQFGLGDDVVVAPVLDKGARARDVWLPPGAWREVGPSLSAGGGLGEGPVHRGPVWLRGLAAPLDVLPVFVRVQE